MAIDVKKLAAFVKSGLSIYPMPSVATSTPFLPEGLEEGDLEEIREELSDESTEASQLKRKLMMDVSYMELNKPGGAFSCGECKWATPEGVCLHYLVRAPIDPVYGCCNLYDPATAQVVFPPTNKPEAAHETESPAEDEDEGGGEEPDDDTDEEE